MSTDLNLACNSQNKWAMRTLKSLPPYPSKDGQIQKRAAAERLCYRCIFGEAEHGFVVDLSDDAIRQRADAMVAHIQQGSVYIAGITGNQIRKYLPPAV